MNDAEIRVNAMIAEYRNAVGTATAILADRCAFLAAELATAQARLKAWSEPKQTADVVPIKGATE